jgi:peptide/nickel transport system substrate-binding protein
VAAVFIVGVAAGGAAATNAAGRVPASSRAGGGNLSVRLLGDFSNFDPSGPPGQRPGDLPTMTALYDRLLAPGPKGKLYPYLASSWTASPSFNTITFTLKRGVTCTDGTALNAGDVANSFKRLFVSPSVQFALTGSPSVSANNKKGTVTFRFVQPNPDNIYGFASPFAGVICPAGLANPSQLQTTPSGTGAYMLTSAVHNGSVVLTRNPKWTWGPHGLTWKNLPQTLTEQVIPDDTTTANELITGALDSGQVVGADVPRLRADRSLTEIATSSPKLIPMVMNQSPGHVTADPQVRRAIMTAFDPRAWAHAAFPGSGIALGTSLFAKSSPCYDPATAKLVPKYSLAAAKQILLADGYSDDNGTLMKNGSPLSITVLGAPSHWGAGTQYVASQLSSLGMKVTLEDLTFSAYGGAYIGGRFDISFTTTSAPNPAPSTFMSIVSGATPESGGGTNYARVIDPVLAADVTAATSAVGPNRCKAWNKVQERALTNYDWLPLATPTVYFFAQKGITVDFISSSYIETETLRRK